MVHSVLKDEHMNKCSWHLARGFSGQRKTVFVGERWAVRVLGLVGGLRALEVQGRLALYVLCQICR